MRIDAILKSGAQKRDISDTGHIALDAPSVVRIDVGPEQLLRYERDGNDLVLVLRDGSVLRIDGFFVVSNGERNDLVFVDDDGVSWWAQYGDVWTGFDIAEIETGVVTPPPFMPLLAGLGVLGGGVALAGGSSSGSSNAAPVGTGDVVETPEDTPVTGSVTGTDADGDDLTFTLKDGPSNGTVTVNPDGSYEYTPDPDYNGPDSFTVTIDDGNGGTDTVTVDVTVTPVNDPPVGTGDVVETPEDTPVTGSVTGTDDDGDDLTFSLKDGPSNGTVTVNPDGSYEYTPDPDYNGPDSFTVTIDDGNGGTDTVTVDVTVTPVNDPPVGTGDLVETPEDTPVTGSVTGTDDDGDDLTFTLKDGPSNGTVTVNPDGSYEYTPDPDYNGPDSFTVTVDDGNGGTDTVTVDVTVTPVNDPPVGTGDVVETPEDTPVTGSVTGTDVDGDDLTFTLEDGPSNGTVTVNPDGSYEYTPNENYNGPDSFTVTVDDGNGGTDTVTVDVTVTPENDPAVISGDAAGNAVEAGGVDNGTPGNPNVSGTLTVSDVDDGEAVFRTPTSLEGTYGSFTFDAETGAWTYTLDDDRPATEALADGETATDELVVTSLDGTASETITVTVTGTNDVPVVSDDTGAVNEDDDAGTGILSTTGQVTIADPDAGESLFDIDTLTASGSPVGTLTIDADGNWRYEVDNTLDAVQSLAEGATLTETWTVTSADGTATSTITVTVTGTNDDPVISGNSTGSVSEDDTAPVTGQLSHTDIDDGNTHEWTVEGSTGAYGTLTVDEDTGAWSYTLDNANPDVQALGAGETLTEQVTVRVSDNDGGFDEQVVEITITGTNDAPVIVPGGDTTATITEITDGAVGENTLEHSRSGTLELRDADVNDSHTVSAAAQGAGYLGTFIPVINAEGNIDWTFTVDDADLDALNEGDVLTQDYVITVEDEHGATATRTVTVTINGVNDQPDPADDASLIAPGETVVLDVLANDTDADDGETEALTVMAVDGQAIAAGETITLSGGRGTVTLSGSGDLTFVPGPNASGQIVLPYMVDDGSGAANATQTANWVINIAGVDITDNASPADADTPDDVLSSVDDLTEVAITGHAAPGGSVTALTISDGTDSVTVPAENITVNDDGSYSVTADLSSLSDGTLTVTANVEDAHGNETTTTDTIFKDTETPVAIDPVLIEAGVAPTITGTGEAGATISLDVNGDTYETTVQPNGTWSVELPSALDGSDIDIGASAEDAYGNTNTATRSISGLDVVDQVSDAPEDIVVSESGLPGGTAAGGGADTVSSTFALGTVSPALESIVIGGSVTDGAVTGGRVVSLADLTNAGTTPVEITTQYGTLTITGYDAETGVIDYSYALNANTEDHSESEANDRVRETLQVAVVESDGDVRVSQLVVAIEDDAPETPVDDTPVTVTEGGAATGSAFGGDNLLVNDALGADGGRVHEITYTDRSGASVTIAIPEGGSQTVETQYGSLTVASDGAWSYTPVASADHEQPASDTALRDDFSHTTIDGDGDVSPGSATQSITITDTVPEFGTPEGAVVDEQFLPVGSNPDAAQVAVEGSLNLTVRQDSVNVTLATDSAPATLTSGGVALTYTLAADGHSLVAHTGDVNDPVFVVTLTDPTSASAGYTFELLRPLDHDGEDNLDLDFGVLVTDSDGDTDTASFTVTVADDAPVDTVSQTIDEDSDGFSFNISADATADNTTLSQGGAPITGTPDGDGNVVYETEHGRVTVSATGELTYKPDANYSGTEEFSVTTADDGIDATIAVTANVTPLADAPEIGVSAENIGTLEDTAVALGLNAPVIADDGTGDGNNAVSERIGEITLSGLPEGAILQTPVGNVTVDASGTVTIALSDVATVDGATADLTMTASEFEALEVLPPEDSAANFEVTYSVTSYEVDETGAPLPDVDGATSSETVTVYVQAVTDNAALVFDDSVDAAAVENADAISYTGNTQADVTLAEDTAINLSQILAASFTDLDGSEVRSVTISNTTGHDIVVNGQTVADGQDITVPSSALSGDTGGLPEILIGASPDFSGDLNGIGVTLNAQDRDADGYLDGSTVVPGTVDGVAEADLSDNTVTLNLHVTPVADDVTVAPAAGDEDTAIGFLAGVGLSDSSSDPADGGSEVITSVSFEVPDGWTVNAPADLPAGVTATAGLSGTTYTISFSAGDEAGREAYLDGFTITPPNHESGTETIQLTVATEDSSVVNGTPQTDSASAIHDLVVTVNPVAETVGSDSDGDGTADLTMTGGFTYETPGLEDSWFDLNSEGFDLTDGWSNQDPNETTYARITPELFAGDGEPADAIGSRLRWVDEGGQTREVVFTGAPINVPVEALDTLEFRAADNFSGRFSLKVEAYTVDDGDDGNGPRDTAVSGEAYLQNILIAPSADEVTLSLAARTQGLEDSNIPLVIRPTSSDPSEIFTVTIDNIPDGAVLTYGGTVLNVVDGSVTIENFDRTAVFTIRPPENSNEDFALNVSAVSVDRLEIDGTVYEDVSDPISLDVNVEVRGVADDAVITATPQTYSEEAVDSGAESVALSSLLTTEMVDSDGSETLTLQVTGLPEGFGLTHGTLLTPPDVTGADRVWVIQQSQLGSTEITVLQNFSGEVVFDVAPVTTENDGDSQTGDPVDISFTVTPSPEATVTTSTTLTEDVLQPINLGIAHQDGDTDETLEAVRIAVDDAEGGQFTLYLGEAGSEVPLSEAGLTIVEVDGVSYYELTGEQAGLLSAQGAANLDGALGGFDLLYQITDPGNGTVDPVTSDWQSGRFDLTATPVTDQPDLSIDNIGLGAGGGEVEGNNVTVTNPGETVTLDLNIASPDSDGSEHLVRVIVDGLPDGVTLEGGEKLGDGSWMLIYEGAEALAIDDAGGLVLPLEFTVGSFAGNLSDVPVTITVQTQDRGNEVDPGTGVLEDTIGWNLSTSFDEGEGGFPPTIDNWSYTDAPATEDTSFTLSEMIDAQVTAQSSEPSVLTVTITDLPPGTDVSGMVRTVVGGQEVWTASVTTEPGDTASNVQAKLDALLDGISMQTGNNRNDNNLDEPFSFNAQLTTALAGGGRSDTAAITPEIPLEPVTDPANISIALGASDDDGKLTETDSEIPLTVTVNNGADGDYATLENGTLYLQVNGTNGLDAGTLTLDGVTYEPVSVSGVEGIPDGTYYVIEGAEMGVPLDMVFTPDTMTAGSVTIDAWVRNSETGAASPLTSTGSTTLPVEISNDGVTLANPGPTTGAEAADSSTDSLIALDLSLNLADVDGSEEIISVLLSNLPEGFLIYTGSDPDNASLAEMAVNAGGTGGTNTWVLAGDGEALPPYVGILPPKHWSGTLSDLQLSVTSGETALPEKRVDVLDVGDVTVNPVANGVEMTTTNSFGREGAIVSLNLNASMTDFEDASVDAATDESQETVTLELQGLGAFASFYIGTQLIEAAGYDAATDTYTLTGLSQSDLDALGVRQAADALSDQDADTTGVQINVTARTVDGADVSDEATSTVTLNLHNQIPTNGDDSLIWTGGLINGLAGEDTVSLRQGESLEGADLAAQLRNIETLDLGIDGANEVTGLTPEQVEAMTSNGNALTMRGSSEDGVSLDGDWTDNEDGTYTGTLAGGTEVTLTVEGVTVTPPADGFSQPSAESPIMMSMASFSPEGFGLAALDAGAKETETGLKDSVSLSLDEVLSSDIAVEDLTAALPEETAREATETGDGPSADWSAPVPASDDDLQPNPVYEV
ncbi:Ig-like domain-containing protein [Martelella sp. FOR1707]